MLILDGFVEGITDWVMFSNIILEKGIEMFTLTEDMTLKQTLGQVKGTCFRMREGVKEKAT